jgi:hypothetical protein
MDPEKTPDKTTGRQVLVVVGVLGAIAVNIAAFMLSADAINAVAVAAGISKKIAWAMVAAVDGLMVTGTVVFIANKLRGRSVTYPLAVLGSGVLLSIWCNALHAKAGGGHIVHLGSNAKMGVSAIPAVSLALSFHLIADMVKDSLGITAETPETVSEPVSGAVPDTAQNTTRPVSSAVPGPVSNTPADTPQNMAADTARTMSSTRANTGQNMPPKRAGAERSRRGKAAKETREEAARRIYDAHMAEQHEVISNAALREELRKAGHPTGNRTAADLLVEFKAHPLRIAN